MDDALLAILSRGSLLLLLVGLILAGLGFPFPEDLILLLAGGLARASGLPLPLVVALCGIGVLSGDVILFSTARRLGPAALERPSIRWLLPPERKTKLEKMFERRGGAVVFGARHVAGLRAPVFALAGMNGMSLRRFLSWDALGAMISVPVVTTLGFFFSDHVARIWHGVAHVEHWAGALAAIGLVIYVTSIYLRRHRSVAGASKNATSDGEKG